jgi:hypothetical protein
MTIDHLPITERPLFSPAPRRGGLRLARLIGFALLSLLGLWLISSGEASAATPNFCPPGTSAGRCNDPVAVAVDQTSGDVYVGEANNHRVDEFTSAGTFLRAFGLGVATGADELQTCTLTCSPGLELGGHPADIAVDNSAGPSAGDIYVYSGTAGALIEKYRFDPAAGDFEQLSTFVPPSPGTGPGQLSGEAHPLAVDASGDLWVGDVGRLEEFSELGGLLSEVPLAGAGTISGLAIDTDPSSPSFGDFYTVKPPTRGSLEVQALAPPVSGTYTLSFAGKTTKAVSALASAGEIQGDLEELPTVGPGNVDVTAGLAAYAYIIRFRHALAYVDVEQIVPAGGATVETVGNGQPGVAGTVSRRLPTGALVETVDSAGNPTAVALDPASGDLLVSDEPIAEFSEPGGEFTAATLLKYGPSGAQVAAFGSGEVIGRESANIPGNILAFGTTARHLYVVSSAPGENSAAQAFALPAPGPLPISAEATGIGKTSATLCAKVDPEGASTTAHFQYLAAQLYEEDGDAFGAGTIETPESGSLGSDFGSHELCQPISPLLPAGAYRFRVVATNPDAEPGGVRGEVAEFSALPAAAIDSTGAADVTADSATLEALIDPLGDATSYHFEFLTEAASLADEAAGESAFSGAAQAPLGGVAIGSGSADVAVSRHVQGLAPGTTYRFRAVIDNAVSESHGGPFAGPTRTFTTQIPSASGLPDGRAWEQVSPVDKHGASLSRIGIGREAAIQAAASGDAITFVGSGPTEAQPEGEGPRTQVLAIRDDSGWSSRDLNPPHVPAAPVGITSGNEYPFFSSDLSRALLSPNGPFLASLSPAASEQTPYLRSNFEPGASTVFCGSGCYRPLVTGCPASGQCSPAVAPEADVPAGVEFGSGCAGLQRECGPEFLTATPDLAHAVLQSGAPLVQGAPGGSFYEWSSDLPAGERLRLLSVLPDGEPAASSGGSLVAGTTHALQVNDRDLISVDGSRVAFAVGGEHPHLYLRINATAPPTATGECDAAEPDRACTIQLDALQPGAPGARQTPGATFQVASVDGSRIFFTDSQQLLPDSGETTSEHGDLYECHVVIEAGVPRCDLSDLTPETGGESAGVLNLIPGSSEDGSYVYFVAQGVLASNAGPSGEHASPGGCDSADGGATCNLYLRHAGTTTFIARISQEDSPDFAEGLDSLSELTARVSPDGRWLAFMSDRSLTGYDNRDAVSGEPDEEVYLYHASASPGGEGTLVCASCDPSGARPDGLQATDSYKANALVDIAMWSSSDWIAANIPGWTETTTPRSSHQSRYLSDQGRLFFNSSDALVPADTNGAEDVYEYEPPDSAEEAPPADGCTTGSASYSPVSLGCVDLISSGASNSESAFLDASESGDDVFFLTSARLASTDTDTSLDVYDARVGGGFPQATRPVECSGDACQQPATPPVGATPGSLTFSGPGNVLECPKGKVARGGRCVAAKGQRKHHAKKHRKHHKKPHSTTLGKSGKPSSGSSRKAGK